MLLGSPNWKEINRSNCMHKDQVRRRISLLKTELKSVGISMVAHSCCTADKQSKDEAQIRRHDETFRTFRKDKESKRLHRKLLSFKVPARDKTVSGGDDISTVRFNVFAQGERIFGYVVD